SEEVGEEVGEEVEEEERGKNHHPLHRGYATLSYEYQQGIVTPLALFREGDHGWSPLTLNELKTWLGLIIYMGSSDQCGGRIMESGRKIRNKKIYVLYRLQQIKQHQVNLIRIGTLK
ncbi:40780_t:CDS:2, partial [Gigaspora margarita]